MVKKQPNYKLQVLYAVTLAFTMVFLLHIAKGKFSLIDTSQSEDTLGNTFKGDRVQEAVVAWGIIAFVLFSMSTFDTTAGLAAAFAWLLLLSVLIINADTLLVLAGKAPGGGSYGGSSKKKAR